VAPPGGGCQAAAESAAAAAAVNRHAMAQAGASTPSEVRGRGAVVGAWFCGKWVKLPARPLL
jgi:hypothetical protein